MVDLEQPTVPIRVLNLSEKEQRIKSGVAVAMCASVQSVLSKDGGTAAPSKQVLPDHLRDLYQRSVDGLDPARQTQVCTLLCEYSDVFSKGPQDLGHTEVIQHRINTQDAVPIRQPPRRLPLAKQREAGQAIEEMKRDGVIEPSVSPWAAPIVLVRKKDGSTRFCVDYRKLNNVTRKDSYPLPRIDDTLEALSGATWFSSLDLKSGYWQVGVHPEDREKTAFTTGRGLWQFRVMPFGLCNAPATFERLMEKVLAGLPLSVCLVYLDDILVPARSFDGHIQNLRTVFSRLREANLKLSPKKCTLFRRQLKFLGHIVSESGVSTDPKKLEAVINWPTPTNVSEVRRFLGLCSYYRRFVPNFADTAHPLHQCTEHTQVFDWNPDAQLAFANLKRALVEAPILGYPDPDGHFILDTDASAYGIGAVLSQIQNGEERVVAYFSRALSRPERQYCVTRRELLAVVRSVQHFHPYLYGRHFTIRTDHAALRWLLSFRSPEGQVARWIECLEQYDFQIEHRPGAKHGNADALSRRPCLSNDCRHCDRLEIKEPTVQMMKCTNLLPSSRRAMHQLAPHWSVKDLQLAQLEDNTIGPIAKWLKNSQDRPPKSDVSPYSEATKLYWAQWDSLHLKDGLVYRLWEAPAGDSSVWQLLLPKKLREEVLYQLHEIPTAGHLGIAKTLHRVRQRYYWVGCHQDVQQWCKSCDACAARKGPPKAIRAPMAQHNVGAPMERIAVDVLGPLPESEQGNKYLLIMADYFTKWTEAFPMQNQEANRVAEIVVKEVVSRYGVPLALHSDQGRNFESTVFTEMCRLLGIQKTRTTPLHPQSDGMVECFNRTLEAQLAKFVSDHQRDWDHHLPLLMMAYRTSVHDTTGETPAMMMMGRDLRLPVDLFIGRPEDEPPVQKSDYAQNLLNRLEKVHDYARQHLKMKSDKMKSHYDLQAIGDELKEGDAVWLYNPQRKKGVSPKLSQPWQGPYVVTKRINDLVYRIRLGPRQKPKVVHRNRLWAYSGKHPPTWHLCQTQSRQSPTRATSPVGEELLSERDDEETMEDTSPEPDSTALRRSGRACRPPARYDPSI